MKNMSLFCPFSMSSFMEYTCPCGKKHKSRNTVSRHKKAEAQKAVLGGVPKDVLKDKKGQKKDVPKDKEGQEKGQEKGQSFLKEIKLLETYEKMTETITPKKEEPKYKCDACSGTFNERHKRCPHCGVEFA